MSNNSVAVGSLYELNQQAYNGISPLTDEEIANNLSNVFEWLYERRCSCAMLLCHDRRDYTIFNYIEKRKGAYEDGTLGDLRECLENRGKILDVQYLQDNDCWEIWLRIFNQETCTPENYMYMFFDAEDFVVEV